jgi:multiple sugar transport system permease protein
MMVLSLALSMMLGQHGTNYQLLMAASVLAAAPMLALFIIAQRYFIQGIAMSGIKS